jgi:chaperonin cofactor prefoldin
MEFRKQQKQSVAYCDSLREKLDRYSDRIDTLHLQKQQLSAELKLLRELYAEPKDAEQAG